MTAPEVQKAPESKFPTEVIDLPSKGWFYPEGHPLAVGTVELFYMTAKHEDILTSRNLIQKGVVIDRLLESLLVNRQLKMDDILLSDKNAIMIASRILGYGKEYTVSISCPSCDKVHDKSIDLEAIGDKQSPLFKNEYKGRNAFPFQLPISKKTIEFKLLTHGDEKNIRGEIEGMKKVVQGDIMPESTTRLRHSIVSIDGNTDKGAIRAFVDAMPARDAMALREHIRQVAPDVDLTYYFECNNCDYEGRVDIPIDVTFFWPGAKV